MKHIWVVLSLTYGLPFEAAFSTQRKAREYIRKNPHPIYRQVDQKVLLDPIDSVWRK